MKKFIVSIFVIFSTVMCFAAGGGDGGGTVQTSTRTTTGSNGVTTRTTNYSAGVNSGGGANVAPCKGKKENDSCSSVRGTGKCKKQDGELVCKMSKCNNEKGYYKEHFTLETDKNGVAKCKYRWDSPVFAGSADAEYDQVQICGYKGFCRTKAEARKANKCGDADAALFVLDDGEYVIAGCTDTTKETRRCDSGYILKGTDCVPCSECNPKNANCEVFSDGINECWYQTSCFDGYVEQSGKDTSKPICILIGEKDCVDAGGRWNNGQCKCNPEISGAHFDVKTKQCVCDDSGQEIKGNQCVNKIKCPQYATGTPPKCDCKDKEKIYDAGDNQCKCPADKPVWSNGHCVSKDEDKCHTAGGQWVNGQCKCKPFVFDTHFDIDKKQCVCDDENKVLNTVGLNCIIPTKCPDGKGTPPNCSCSDDGKEYDKTTNKCVSKCNEEIAKWDGEKCECKESGKEYNTETKTCECPSDKPEYVDGKCVATSQTEEEIPPETPQLTCPTGSSGEYPDCNCGNGKEYNKDNNTCDEISQEDDNEEDDEPVITESPEPECPSDSTGDYPDCKCNGKNRIYDAKKNECVDDKLGMAHDDYEEARATEQSKENRMLTAGAITATGIGGMELAQGLAEQKADKAAAQDMTAYIATMRCKYGKDKQVKAGPDEIELPGGNDANMTKLRTEYFTLAKDLKERKTALGMKPGIESEEILDKAQTGLYDQENLGIDSGAYASLYRAQMLGSEKDQAMIDEEQKKSKTRVTAGGVAVGVGVVGGILGDSLINGKLGEKIKERKQDKKFLAENTTKLSKSSTELLRKKRTGTVLSTADTNELLKAIQDKFK